MWFKLREIQTAQRNGLKSPETGPYINGKKQTREVAFQITEKMRFSLIYSDDIQFMVMTHKSMHMNSLLKYEKRNFRVFVRRYKGIFSYLLIQRWFLRHYDVNYKKI